MDANLKREKPADMLRVEAAYCEDEIVGLRITADNPEDPLLIWADNSFMKGFRVGKEFVANWGKKIEYRDVVIGEPEPAAPAAAITPKPDEWDVRGHLAASLTFWHRLKSGEDDELVAALKSWGTRTQPAAAPSMKRPAQLVYLVATGETRNGIELYERHDKMVHMADVEVLYKTPELDGEAPAGAWIERWHGSGGKDGYEGWSIVNKEGRGLVAYLGRNVESGAVTEIVMAHNATLAAPTAQVAQVAPAGTTLPEGWVSLTITHEGQYAEEVAYGPQRMMDRLGKWLVKYFAKTAAPAQIPDLQPLHNLLYLAQRQNSLGAMRCAITEARLELAKVRADATALRADSAQGGA